MRVDLPIEALIDLLKERYQIRARSLRPLAELPDKLVYRAVVNGQTSWVVRFYAQTGHSEMASHLATILAFLENRGYPAERIVRAADGSALVAPAEGWQIVVTTFLHGTTTGLSRASLHHLGAALGQLHALGPRASEGMPVSLPRAAMLPTNELRWAAEQLAKVERQVPRSLWTRYDQLVRAIEGTQRCEDLPSVVIHNDCHPANSVRTRDGAVVLCDWEGAGLGPAVIDVGFLLASVEIPYRSTAPLGPDRGRVAAIAAGYARHQHLRSADLDRLPDAIRFRSVVAGAASLAEAIIGGWADDGPSWWWNRYVAADEIARRARACWPRF